MPSGCTLKDDGLDCRCAGEAQRCAYAYPLVQYDVPTSAGLNEAYSVTRVRYALEASGLPNRAPT